MELAQVEFERILCSSDELFQDVSRLQGCLTAAELWHGRLAKSDLDLPWLVSSYKTVLSFQGRERGDLEDSRRTRG